VCVNHLLLLSAAIGASRKAMSTLTATETNAVAHCYVSFFQRVAKAC
jgi:hypothetical protein